MEGRGGSGWLSSVSLPFPVSPPAHQQTSELSSNYYLPSQIIFFVVLEVVIIFVKL